MPGNKNILVIGIDAQFGEQTNIDRVERALYLGKVLGKDVSELQAESLSTLCASSVERLALANKLDAAEINLILVSEVTPTISIENATVVTNLAEALFLTQSLLEQDKVVALVGANLLSNDDNEEATQTNQANQANEATISFDETFGEYRTVNGIASILFSTEQFAASNQSYVYARLKGFASTASFTGGSLADIAKKAMKIANVDAQNIGLLEVSALADKALAKIESEALLNVFDSNTSDSNTSDSNLSQKSLHTAISCARSVTGEGGGFSQIAGLLRTVIALQQRYIPAITDWQQPKTAELTAWQASSFYLPTESRPWYPEIDGSAHFAAYSCLSGTIEHHHYCHIILQENKLEVAGEKHPVDDIRKNGFIASSDLYLVLVSGENEQAIVNNLKRLEQRTDPLNEIAKDCFIQADKASKASNSEVFDFTVALICESKEELIKEIQSAKTGVVNAFASKKDWRTPKGSFFTAVPVNSLPGTSLPGNKETKDSQNIAFLYPGIGATYVGLGRDLFHLFPEIHQDVANLADDIGASLKDTLLNPRSIIRHDFKTLKQLDLDLRGNLANIAEAGVGFACVFTKVFENVFKVKADFATGYSMGEVSMYAALGAWQQPGLMCERLAHSETFNHRLCGDLLTLREHWGLSGDSFDEDETLWETYTIKATLEQVEQASIDEDRVYCTIINTPDSLLLAGYPQACQRVIKKLGVRSMALNMANAIHSAPAKKEYNDMVQLYTMDVTDRLKTKMYSSSCYLPVPQMSKAIANSVAKCLCDMVDFPRLINTMHDKGARVFIEMGPGRSLCSWVDKILDHGTETKTQKKPRVSVPVNAKGTSDELTYIRALAKLVSHGVKLDLDTLFNGSIVVNKA
ncbi:MAG: PfaB family protein [Alteromonadaceae bacterium]|nr:PfaB family protein [Alteromonadaceae bacterium]